jgi:ABC-type multidrug transport system fused ATPase/permease subunit
VDSFWDFFWLMVWGFFFIAYLIVMFQIVLDIFRDRDTSGWVKAMWIIGLIIFPIIVALIYLIARGQGMAGRQMASAHAAQEQSNAYIRSVAGSASPADEIARAQALLDSGAIDANEFAQLKAKALSSS